MNVVSQVRWPGRSRRRGQGLVEYGLILGLIAVVCIASLSSTGSNVNVFIQKVSSSLSTVGGQGSGGNGPR